MLIEKVRTDLYQATKARDLPRVRALRMLISSLEYLEKRGSQVTTEDEMAAVKLEIKKRKEAIEAFGQVGEQERVKDEEDEMKVLMEYMPEQVGEDEVRKVVSEVVGEAGEGVNKGMVIGKVIGKIGKEKVDGNLVARIVNELVK
jgi:uncharacterized protein YqeY